MSEDSIRIVRLEPLRVASVLGFGREPETEALSKLAAWAEPRGYLNPGRSRRVFGFNNPSPAPGSPNYGYEVWITVDQDVQTGSGVEIKDFAGGLYAVMRCPVSGDPGEVIPMAWKELALWREESHYRPAHHQWLEEHLIGVETPGGFTLDLYLPITE
jgi:AraC family transcriptional regulator